MGMLRTGLILAVGFALLPSPPGDETGAQEPAPSTFAYIAAATETLADMKGFCARNPNACHIAGSVAETVESKVRYSIKLAYEWAEDKPKVDHGTLTKDDMKAAWNGPTI
jgi:hypothetical protein